jgi:phosphatidylglycerophosphate synthase
MNGSFFHTVSEIKRLYVAQKLRDEMRGEWGAAVFYRWISFFISALFIKCGVSANTVTGISIILCLLLPLVLLVNPDEAYIYLALGGFTIAILDCVDGNIARATNTTSFKGQYLDFITDILYRVFLYTTLGLIIQIDSVGNVFLSRNADFFCLLSATLAIIARLCRVYTENRFSDNNSISTNNKSKAIIFSFLSGLDQILPIFILVAGIFDLLFWVMIWIMFYSLLDFIYTQMNNFRRLQ